MDRIVKVFCAGGEQQRIAEAHSVIMRYPGFILVSVPESALAALSRNMLIEDITDLYAVRIAGREIGASESAGGRRAPGSEKAPRRLATGKHHYLLQFIGPIMPEWLRGLRDVGAEPRAPYQNFTYVVRMDAKAVRDSIALPFVKWVRHLPHWARIATALREKGTAEPAAKRLPRTKMLEGVYSVEFFGSDDLPGAIRQLKKLKVKVLGGDEKGKVLAVQVGGSASVRRRTIEAISKVHGVRSIRGRAIKRSSNDVAADIMGTKVSMAGDGLALSGKGEVIAICDTGLDTGDPASIHPDFAARISSITSYPIADDFSPYIDNPGADDGPSDLDTGHGTHVSGSALGSGAASVSMPSRTRSIRGLAYGATLVFQAVEQELKWKDPLDLQRYGRYLLAGLPADIKKLFNFAYGKGARIHSDSWGGGDAGAYDTQCEQLDQFVWEHKDFCVVVAAGNDGKDEDGDGRIDLMSVSSPGTAKNCITVGACENKRPVFNADTYGGWWRDDYPAAPFKDDPMADDPDDVAAFSSRGPTLDNRVKPDVIAPGTFILSTRSSLLAANNSGWSAFPPNKSYFFMGGTSMAAPLTAGAVALVREHLKKHEKIRNPSAALLKAALVTGARRLPGFGNGVFDFNQGFGRVNLDAVLSPPLPASSRFWEFQPGIRTGDFVSRNVMLRSARASLRVVLAYSDYPGRSLVNNLNLIVRSPNGRVFPGNLGATPDCANNVEVVRVQKPAAGKWQVQVVGSNVPQGPQEFAVVCIGDLG